MLLPLQRFPLLRFGGSLGLFGGPEGGWNGAPGDSRGSPGDVCGGSRGPADAFFEGLLGHFRVFRSSWKLPQVSPWQFSGLSIVFEAAAGVADMIHLGFTVRLGISGQNPRASFLYRSL